MALEGCIVFLKYYIDIWLNRGYGKRKSRVSPSPGISKDLVGAKSQTAKGEGTTTIRVSISHRFIINIRQQQYPVVQRVSDCAALICAHHHASSYKARATRVGTMH